MCMFHTVKYLREKLVLISCKGRKAGFGLQIYELPLQHTAFLLFGVAVLHAIDLEG